MTPSVIEPATFRLVAQCLKMVWYKINYRDEFYECRTFPLLINAALFLGRGIILVTSRFEIHPNKIPVTKLYLAENIKLMHYKVKTIYA